MTKVIEFIPRLNDGGAETLVKDYAIMANKEVFQIKVLVLYDNQETAVKRVLSENGIEVLSVYKTWGFTDKVIHRIAHQRYTQKRLREIIKSEQPQCIHIHMWLLSYLSPLAEELKNIKLFYTCHNLPERYFGGENIQELYAAKQLINQCGLTMIALHNGMADELNRLLGINSTIVIRNGIDISRFRNIPEDKCAIRKSLNIPENAFVVGNVGRLHRQKNQLFLISVFTNLLKINKNAFLLLVGSGTELPNIVQAIEANGIADKVLILSHRSDIPRIMKALDVFVFPSIYEGFGIVAVEAQAAGVRCIISDNVPDEVILTDSTIKLSLDAPINNWVNAIIDDTIRNESHGNLMDYDMKSEIQRLEELYQS